MELYPFGIKGKLFIPAASDEEARALAESIVASMNHDLAKTVEKDNCEALAASVELGNVSKSMPVTRKVVEKLAGQIEMKLVAAG